MVSVLTWVETPPAHIWALQALRRQLLGTAAKPSDDDDPYETLIAKLKTPGILRTPGTPGTRKSVTFEPETSPSKRFKSKRGGFGLPKNLPGRFPSPWTPKVAAMRDTEARGETEDQSSESSVVDLSQFVEIIERNNKQLLDILENCNNSNTTVEESVDAAKDHLRQDQEHLQALKQSFDDYQEHLVVRCERAELNLSQMEAELEAAKEESEQRKVAYDALMAKAKRLRSELQVEREQQQYDDESEAMKQKYKDLKKDMSELKEKLRQTELIEIENTSLQNQSALDKREIHELSSENGHLKSELEQHRLSTRVVLLDQVSPVKAAVGSSNTVKNAQDVELKYRKSKIQNQHLAAENDRLRRQLADGQGAKENASSPNSITKRQRTSRLKNDGFNVPALVVPQQPRSHLKSLSLNAISFDDSKREVSLNKKNSLMI